MHGPLNVEFDLCVLIFVTYVIRMVCNSSYNFGYPSQCTVYVKYIIMYFI